MKLGRRGPEDPRDPGYPGGSVWETAGDARRHCPAGYDVFGVAAEWRVDTEPSRGGPWDDLLIDSGIVRLAPRDGPAPPSVGGAAPRRGAARHTTPRAAAGAAPRQIFATLF